MKSRYLLLSLVFFVLLFTACGGGDDKPPADGGQDADTGADAGVDAGTDAGPDAGPYADAGGDPGGDTEPVDPVEGFGPASRWVGWLNVSLDSLDPLVDPCPAPSGPLGNWRYGRLFSARDLIADNGGFDSQGDLTDAGQALLDTIKQVGEPDVWYTLPGEGVFCLYEWTAAPVDAALSEDLASRLPRQIRSNRPDPDLPALVPLDMTPDELSASVAGRFHDFALAQLGASGFERVPGFAPSPVLVAVLDSAVTDDGKGEGLPGHGRLDHGRDMGLWIRRLACPANQLPGTGLCAVRLSNYLVLDRAPDGQGGSVIDRAQGGYFGTPGTLAVMIWRALVMGRHRAPDANLVINMSVGWEGSPELPTASHVAQAVRGALSHARCGGALPIVAAGNASDGATPRTGPMYPAFFEDYDWAGCDPIAPPGEPMIYSVGGVDGTNRPIASTRENGRPRLAAYARSIAVDQRYLDPGSAADPAWGESNWTGTSVAAAAASATAAAVWSYNPEVTAGTVMGVIYDGGLAVPGNPDYCRAPGCMQGEIREINLCRALVRVDAVLDGSCQDPVEANPSWSDEQLAAADLLATPVTAPAQQEQPVAQCGANASLYVPGGEPAPADPCPDAKHENYIASPQLVPQPRKPICTTCVFADSSLYLGPDSSLTAIDGILFDAHPGTLDSLRLKLTGSGRVLYHVLDGLAPAAPVVRIDGLEIPAGFVPETAEINAVLHAHTGQLLSTSEQVPVSK